jgi:hypothetical protein
LIWEEILGIAKEAMTFAKDAGFAIRRAAGIT